MSSATLGFKNGPSITWRIDPDQVDWNWRVDVAVTPTVGGRVVQVLGATLSDLTIQGSFGQVYGDGLQGQSWLQAEAFFKRIQQIMEYQSRDSTRPGKMHPPAVFSYAPRNWKFACYVKSLEDPEGGGSITHSVGKFSHHYVLTLFIVEELSDALVQAGSSHGVYNKLRAEAIDSYLARISDGIGWHFSQYNGNVPATKPAKPANHHPERNPAGAR